MKISTNVDWTDEDMEVATSERIQKQPKLAPLEVKGRKEKKAYRPRHGGEKDMEEIEDRNDRNDRNDRR